jgi:hypothetical protein
MRLRVVCEVRRTADSCQSESEAKLVPELKASLAQGRITWVETECPEASVHEPRIPVQVRNGAGQKSESS